MHKDSSHFQGKSALGHVVEARRKGQKAGAEIHGAEMPGHLSAFADAAKETAVAFLIFWMLLLQLPLSPSQIDWILLSFSAGWLVWKTGRSAMLGWSRLERMHRLIEEERWEIEHHRHQEREELQALYQAKGFSGRLLEEVVDILMADDNRLLEVMLQEELKLPLESFEHPLKQALGAALGVLSSLVVLSLSFFISPLFAALSALAIIGVSTAIAAKLERNDKLPAIVWTLGIGVLAIATSYFIGLALSR